MSPLVRILVGLLIVGAGFVGVWKTQIVVGLFGINNWAERVMGGGQTPTFYKLVSTAVIFVGFIIVTDLFDILFGGIIRTLFRL